MSQKASDATAQKSTEPIKFETVYPIHIRTKDGALSFAAPGETIAFETDEQVKTAMLAHKMNEIIIQLHRLQRVGFANNKILANMLAKTSEVSNGIEKADDSKDAKS